MGDQRAEEREMGAFVHPAPCLPGFCGLAVFSFKGHSFFPVDLSMQLSSLGCCHCSPSLPRPRGCRGLSLTMGFLQAFVDSLFKNFSPLTSF